MVGENISVQDIGRQYDKGGAYIYKAITNNIIWVMKNVLSKRNMPNSPMVEDAPVLVKLEEALSIYRLVSELCRKQGHIAALYGSVLTKGEGRDIDIWIMPHLHFVDERAAIDLLKFIRDELHGRFVSHPHWDFGKKASQQIIIDNKIVLDIVVKLSDAWPR
jgi:hypothetical protein